MLLISGAGYRYLFPFVSVALASLAGCRQEVRPADISVPTSNLAEDSSVISLVSPDSIIEAEPNILHELQLTVMNTGKEDLMGVTPRLPCSCHLVSPLPRSFAAGSNETLIFKVLTPIAGNQLREIDFVDHRGNHVGTVAIEFHVSGEVPRLSRPVRTVHLMHVVNENEMHSVEIEAIENAESPHFLQEAFAADPNIAIVHKIDLTEIPSFDKNFVLRKYRIPVQVITKSPGTVTTNIRLQLSSQVKECAIPLAIDTKPRAQLLPRELVIHSSEDPSTDTMNATFQLISRIPGDVYDIQQYDEDVLSVVRVPSAHHQKWAVHVKHRNPVLTHTKITLISHSGDHAELPVKIE
jgi:hypothetical protein